MPRKAATTSKAVPAPAPADTGKRSTRVKKQTSKAIAEAEEEAEEKKVTTTKKTTATAAPTNKRGAASKKAKVEEEPAPKTATKKTAKGKAKQEEDEEEPKPKAPAARGRGKKTVAAEEVAPPAASASKGSKKRTKATVEEEEEDQKSSSKKKAKPTAKKADGEEEEEEEQKPVLKKAPATTTPAAKGSFIIPVDPYYPNASHSTVHEDFDCMLNQTNINANNNKFYKIQVVKDGGRYVCFTRWGRVGEPGTNQCASFGSPDQAIAAFEGKFRDKTRNAWAQRTSFVKHDGKYQLVHIDHSQSAAAAAALAAARADATGASKAEEVEEVEESALDPQLQQFIKLIFNKEMFNASMSNLKVDVTRLPLGALTKEQIKEGNDILALLMDELDGRARHNMLENLSSRYYTLIPTAVGRSRPPTLNTKEMVQEKFDLLAVLGDIESAQAMEKKAKITKKAPTKKKPNPIDQLYASLEAEMQVVDPSSPEFKYITTYAKMTGGRKILNVFKVDRSTEAGKPFFDDLDNRKLLWHGTNAAVVAAIIKSGLRIMPHSGGRVGRGIYLAAENSKSAGYVWPAPSGGKRIGMMFLAEAALGKEHHIVRDDPSLRAPPKGFDSIVAQGRTDPVPEKDIYVKIDGRQVTVPQGPAMVREKYTGSSFSQSEYLLYTEAQHRLRYVLMFEW